MTKQKRTGFIQLALVVAFIVVAVLIAALMRNDYQPTGSNGGGGRDLYVDTADVTPGPYQLVFDITGAVEARTEIHIVPQVRGRVETVAPDFYTGGAFEKDELLFQIDPRDFEFEIKRLTAEVARARTNLELEKVEARTALEEWSLINGDSPAPDLVARLPQMAEAQAALQAAEALLANARLSLERSAFRFPFHGRVLRSSIAPGQYVSAGQSYGTAFDLSSLDVVASLEGRKLEWLLNTADPRVTITADHLGREVVYEGEFKRGASSLDTGTRFATVRFNFKDSTPDLLPGVFTRITVQGPKLDNITLVPASALQQSGTIWLVEEDSKVRALTPDIVYSANGQLAVRNLTAAATVVTSRLTGVAAGTTVIPLEADDTVTPAPLSAE